MNRVLDPLRQVPGIRRAMLFSHDGVPIVHFECDSGRLREGDRELTDTVEDLSAFAGMASMLLADVRRSIDPMSWGAPHRVVLSATRGTLVLLTTPRLNISVELDCGMAPEELRLPMESVVARLDRATSRKRAESAVDHGREEIEGPPGIFPAAEETFDGVSESRIQAGNQVPKTTTDS